MRKSLTHLVVVFVLVVAFWPATAKAQNSGASGSQTLPEASGSGGPAPYQDLSGTWIGPGEAKLMTDIPPLTPAGQAKLKVNVPDPFSVESNDPWKTCDTFGMPRIVNNEPRNIGFATMPGRIVILENYGHIWREVWMNGQLPKDPGGRDSDYSSRWYGYSVGHWDGPNTLVVETNGLMPQSWVNRLGYPHTAAAEVVERYTRTDHNTLEMTETLIDPAYYTKPYLVSTDTYKWVADQDDPKAAAIPFADEQICIPSEAIKYMNSVEIPAKGDKPIKR